jgi:hypothetical protein
MITNVVIVVVLGLIVAVAFFNKEIFSMKPKGHVYMDKLANYLGVKVETIQDWCHIRRVSFNYKGQAFIYEHQEESGSTDAGPGQGCLKVQTKDDLTLLFSEQKRTTLKSSVISLEDIAKNPWGGDSDKVSLPQSLQEFALTTNNNRKARELLSDEKIVRIFCKFKNRDNRGKPMMSLEITGGEVILHFHAIGSWAPCLLDLQTNVSAIEDFAERLLPVVDKINQLKEEGRG